MLAEALGTTVDALRADMDEQPDTRKTTEPVQFTLSLRLKGHFPSERQKDHLVRLTSDVVQALAREGISVTGHRANVATSRLSPAASWRVLVALPVEVESQLCWLIVALKPARVSAFLEVAQVQSDEIADGELIAWGVGDRPPPEQLERASRLFSCDASSVLDMISPFR